MCLTAKNINKGHAHIIIYRSFKLNSIGVRTFFAPCGPKEDGSWMSCHWAEAALFALAVVLTVQAAIRLALRAPGAKRGAALAMLPVALAAAIVPGGLIPLCMMRTMRCHFLLRPAVILVSVAIIALAGWDALKTLRARR